MLSNSSGDEKPKCVYEEKPSQFNFIYRPEDVAKVLTPERPFFKMHSGGVYAVALTGGNPTHFVKIISNAHDRRQTRTVRRARKLAERNARKLAKATL